MKSFAYKINDINSKFSLLELLMAGYIALLPVQFIAGKGFRFAPSDLFLLLFFFCGVGQIKISKTAWSKWHSSIVIIFLIGSIVAVVKNGHLTRYAFLQKDIGLVFLLAGYIAVTFIASEWSRIRWILRILILSVFIINFISVFELFISYHFNIKLPFFNYYESRLGGLLIDPNAYGGLLVLSFIIQILTFYTDKPLVKGKLGKLTNLSLAVGIILTFSRSAWLGLFLAYLTILAYRPRYAFRIAMLFLLAFVIVLILFGIDFLPILTHMSTRSANSIDARVKLVNDAIPMFLNNPIFGIGLGSFYKIKGIIIHNTPLWFLAEFGILGFTVFLGFVLRFIYWGFKTYKMNRPKEKPIIIGLILAHVAMLGLSMGIEAFYQRHWWFIMALLSASYSITLKDKSDYANGKNMLSSGINNSA